MKFKVLTSTILLVLAFAATSFAQGSVFSLDGGSQVQTFARSPNNLDAMNITNSGFLTTAKDVNGVPTNGNICANVYAFTTAPQMFLCCSCPVKPHQTISLEFNSFQKTTVSVLATPNGGTCNPNTIVQASVIPFGLVASKIDPDGDESNPFIPYILGPIEVSSLTTQCTHTSNQFCLCQ